ncbi:hypothetical protein HU200_055451 [Digitaria exilis]|uniref:Glycosyltransferase n=1 Tax=Digitaria exilis TaxID=1010633 RepID=A0A835ASC7_9POAL|nr:hypothetical protein HU200_055451 [Digitaria exilis]
MAPTPAGTSQPQRAPSPRPPMASSPSPPPHVLLVSAPLQGHVNPLLVLGRRIASRGLLVTFSTIPHAGLKFTHADGEATDIAGRGTLRFEHLKGGDLWPPYDPRFVVNGGDTLRHLEDVELEVDRMLRSCRASGRAMVVGWHDPVDACAPHCATTIKQVRRQDAAPAALAGLIRLQSDAGRPVAVVVASAFVPWAGRVAAGEGVRHTVLWTESCSVLSLFYHFFHSLAGDFPSDTAAPVVGVPGMPAMAAADLPVLIRAPEKFIWRQVLVAELNSLRDDDTAPSWLLVNTFDELEHEAIEALRAHLPSITPVGPLFEPEDEHAGGHGDDAAVDDDYMAWLDAQSPGSVVFVAFGSLMRLGADETTELVAGLAATGRPFLLVARDKNRASLLSDDCLSPAAITGGGGRGKVVAWCSQGRVLSHAAVGCFVTHCGWNSTVEALASGVPVVTFPAWGDQPTNAKFLEDVYGVGVRLPRPMARGNLRRCVEEVMGGPKAAAMRERAGRWKAEARAAAAAGGSSDRGIQGFVDAVVLVVGQLQRSQRNKTGEKKNTTKVASIQECGCGGNDSDRSKPRGCFPRSSPEHAMAEVADVYTQDGTVDMDMKRNLTVKKATDN